MRFWRSGSVNRQKICKKWLIDDLIDLDSPIKKTKVAAAKRRFERASIGAYLGVFRPMVPVRTCDESSDAHGFFVELASRGFRGHPSIPGEWGRVTRHDLSAACGNLGFVVVKRERALNAQLLEVFFHGGHGVLVFECSVKHVSYDAKRGYGDYRRAPVRRVVTSVRDVDSFSAQKVGCRFLRRTAIAQSPAVFSACRGAGRTALRFLAKDT